MKDYVSQHIQQAICGILADYNEGRPIDSLHVVCEPDQQMIHKLTDQLLRIAYPGYFKDRTYRYYAIRNNLTVSIEDIAYNLCRQITNALQNDILKNRYDDRELVQLETDKLLSSEEIRETQEKGDQITIAFLERIPKVREYLATDLEAFFDGDPAAESRDEIILCYPGFYAITVFRMAHELYDLGVPMLPRIMTEYAHTRTGIDINPGATIGKYFFIDHGTGIVVGETTIIGDHVKVYQGVTLGALSTRGGRKLQNHKRHPTIEDNVTIYSGASILGGETVIGHDSVIGGNVFLTSSVQAGTRVSAKHQELRFDSDNHFMEAKEVEPRDEDAWFYVI